MPEHLRLPEEIDAEKKKVLNLETQLRAIQSAAPSLRVVFESGTAFTELTFYEFAVPTAAFKTEALEKAKTEYPKLTSPAFTLLGLGDLEHYNNRIEQYYADLSSHHDELQRLAAWYNITAKISLLIDNRGGAPADDIDILLHFPNGFDVIDEEQLPKPEEEPEPPGKPSDALSRMLEMPRISIPARLPFKLWCTPAD